MKTDVRTRFTKKVIVEAFLSLLREKPLSKITVKEVCEITYNGVSFASLNYGHKIISGLIVIKALQKLYNAYLPVFVDNSEAINSFNMPQMNCQLIQLRVSDDKELRIETE